MCIHRILKNQTRFTNKCARRNLVKLLVPKSQSFLGRYRITYFLDNIRIAMNSIHIIISGSRSRICDTKVQSYRWWINGKILRGEGIWYSSIIKGAYWISSNSSFIFTFLYCSPFSYRSSNFAIAKLSLLLALKSDSEE